MISCARFKLWFELKNVGCRRNECTIGDIYEFSRWLKESDGQMVELPVTQDPSIKKIVDDTWYQLGKEFEELYARLSLEIPEKLMPRTELSFHEQVKLLGYLCVEIADLPGDILEIGVWKGKSLALMERLSSDDTKIVGVDPCELPGQFAELTEFVVHLIPKASVVVGHSEKIAQDVVSFSKKFKLIHIDGGHERFNVWTDFLVYSHFLVADGYIVFDDYNDSAVKAAIDEMHGYGLFDKFNVIGAPTNFPNSFVIQRRRK